MHHIYRLKYPNYDVNKNKIEIISPYFSQPYLNLRVHIGHASSNKANPPNYVLFLCFFTNARSYFFM
jgi:hypothetical protein